MKVSRTFLTELLKKCLINKKQRDKIRISEMKRIYKSQRRHTQGGIASFWFI